MPLFTVANYLQLFTVSAEGIQTTIFRIGKQSQSAKKKIEKLKVLGASLREPTLVGLHCKTHVYVCMSVCVWPYTEKLN